MFIDRLRRVTRDGRWVPEIDGLRFVAIASVLVFHMSGELQVRSGRILTTEPQLWWMYRMFGNGDRGVTLFFVISGMILALPFARQFLLQAKPVSLRKFYLRRLTRIEPPYLISLLLCYALILIHQNGIVESGLARHALASALYQHNLVYGEMSRLNFVTWSLEVEIQFYLFAPLFMQLFRIRARSVRRLVFIALITIIGFAGVPFALYPRFYLSILYYLQYFLMGLLVADIFVLDLEGFKSSWAWDAAGMVALATFFWARHDDQWAHLIMPVFIGLLCVSVMRSILLRKFFANPWIAVFGGMCYSIYLLHFVWIASLFKLTRRAIVPSAIFSVNLLIQMLVTVLPAVILCTIFFVLIERPCMDPDWPSKLWHRVTGRSGHDVDALDSAGISE